MKLVEQIERLKRIHKLIDEQQTGVPAEFANKLHISRRQLYNILEDLKIMEAPIEYNPLQRSYIYTQACEMRLSCDIKTLTKDELGNISGGRVYTTNMEEYRYYEFIKNT
jgi:predicted DNA-binding transcriptional regulator YafY